MYFPVVEALDMLAVAFESDFDYRIVSREEMPDKYGETIPGMNLIRIREDVCSRATLGSGRDRYTIAHEIGHWLLHDLKSISLARSTFANTPKYCQPEWQANEFASHLLMPRELIRNKEVQTIMTECGVSNEAASIQMAKFRIK